MRPAAAWARRLGVLLLAGGLLGAAAFQFSRGFERWAVRAGPVRDEAEALFDPAPAPTRQVLLDVPQKVLLLRPSLVAETYRDPALGEGAEVAVIPNASFTFDQGVLQDKTLALFAGRSLMGAGAGLLLWALSRRAA